MRNGMDMNGRARAGLWCILIVLALSLFAVTCGGGTDADHADGGTDGGSGAFTLTVEGGYGSGVYPAGVEVHVWAAVDPASQLLSAWSGDSELLQDEGEWHTTLTMPARDVTVSARIVNLPIPLTIETLPGRDRLKTVRYHVPANPAGIVLFAHGTGGSGAFIENPEASYVARVLVSAGYAVWSTDAEEVDVGDTDNNGKIRWDASLAPDNVDLANVSLILEQFVEAGLIESDTPRFSLGMSNGGAFSITAGAALGLDAVVSYCAGGRASPATVTGSPTAWFLCEFDRNENVDNHKAVEYHETLLDRGVPTELHVHGPSPLYDERFERIAGIDAATSAAIAGDLLAAGHVAGDGFVVDDVDMIAAAVRAAPADYRAVSGLQGVQLLRVVNQLRILTADHQMYDDYARRTLYFIQAHTEP